MSFDGAEAAWQEQVAAARAAVERRHTAPLQLQRVLLFLAGSFLLCFLIFVVGVAVGVRGQDVPMLGLASLTIFLASIPLAVNQGIERHDRHIFLSLLCLVIVARYATPAFTLYIPAAGPVDAPGMAFSNLLPDDIVVGQLMALLAFSVLFVAYTLPVGRVVAARLPKPRIDWPNSTILLVAMAMMGIGWPLRIAGGLGVLPEAMTTGIFATIIDGTIYCNALLALAWLRHRSVLAAALVGTNVLLGGAIGLMTGSKQEVLIRPAIVAISWILVRGTIPARWVILGIVALSLVYPASQFIKEFGASSAISFSNPTETLSAIASYAGKWEAGEWFVSGLQHTAARVDSLGSSSVLIRDTPSVSPFQYGSTLGLFFVAFIPRVIWPSKPVIGIGPWVTKTYGSGEIFDFHTAPTQIGEFYINFGIAGVILGFALVGVIIRLAHESLMWRGGTAASILALSVILYRYTIGFDAGIAQSYAAIVFAIVPVALIQMLARLTLPTYDRERRARS